MTEFQLHSFSAEKHSIGDLPVLMFVEPEGGSEISSFDARYFKRVKEGKKKTKDFTLFVECKVFFESEFVEFEVYCIAK